MRRHRYIWNLPFAAALVVLLLNDHYWKWEYGNVLTGKLSDVAGLILLPLLLAYCWPRQGRWMPLLSGLFFLWWKSAGSEAALAWYNTWAPIPLSRVIDYTDYWALLVLIPVYAYLRHLDSVPATPPSHNRYSSAATGILALLTVLAFSATSPPHYFYYLHDTAELSLYKARYKVRLSTAEVLQRWEATGYTFHPDSALIDSLRRTTYYRFENLSVADSIYYRFPAVVLSNDTVEGVQVCLLPYPAERTTVIITGLQQPDLLPAGQPREDLQKYLDKQLKKKLIIPLRRKE
jgi:hypothetical protein